MQIDDVKHWLNTAVRLGRKPWSQYDFTDTDNPHST